MTKPIPDLDPYTAAPEAEMLGLTPLAVGWLDKRAPFPTAVPTAALLLLLLPFCLENNVVYPWPRPQPCPLCGKVIPATDEPEGGRYVPGKGEIRVIGEEDIFAAPSLIYHYVAAHNYQPPAEFIAAVLHGPQPNTAEYTALLRSLRM